MYNTKKRPAGPLAHPLNLESLPKVRSISPKKQRPVIADKSRRHSMPKFEFTNSSHPNSLVYTGNALTFSSSFNLKEYNGVHKETFTSQQHHAPPTETDKLQKSTMIAIERRRRDSSWDTPLGKTSDQVAVIPTRFSVRPAPHDTSGLIVPNTSPDYVRPQVFTFYVRMFTTAIVY